MNIFKLILIFLSYSYLLYSQDIEVFSYNIESGLPTNLTKAVYQDKAGYLWIGTDAGLFRFDGKNFKSFNDKLSSLFIKDIKKYDENSFLVITDSDLLKFNLYKNNYIVENIIKNNENFDLDYPKQIFSGLDSGIWITGINNVFHLKDSKLKKYNVDTNYTADSYFRSFQLFDVKNSGLYLLSLTGALFKFNKEQDRFDFLSDKLIKEGIEYYSIFSFDGSSFLLGTSKGLKKISFKEGNLISIESNFTVLSQNEVKGTLKYRFNNEILSICTIEGNANGIIYLADWTKGIYELNLSALKILKVNENSISSIKNLYSGNDNSLWVAGDEGVFQIKKKVFKAINISKFFKNAENLYPRMLRISIDDKVYFTDTKDLYQITYKDRKHFINRFQNTNNSLIYTFNISGNDLWISYQNNRLERIKILNSVTFTTKMLYFKHISNDRLSNIFIDSKGNLWGYLERSSRLLKIDTLYHEKYYEIPYAKNIRVDVIKESNMGKIVLGGSSDNSMMFEYDNTTDKILPIKINNYDSFKKGIIIYDIDLSIENSIMIASNKGLIKLTNNSIQRVETTNEFENVPFRAIYRGHNDELYFGSDRGLFYISKESKTYFKKSSGLPNSTIVLNGIVIDSKKNVWIGTASGLAFRDAEKDVIPSIASPKIIDFSEKYDNRFDEITADIKLNKQIEAAFQSLTFPSENIVYQYRILGYDSTWSDYERNNRITLPLLAVGDYVFEVRAFSPGYFESNITIHHFSVRAPFYLTYWAYFIYIVIGIFILVIVINTFFRYRINLYAKRELELSEIVTAKTNELREEKEKTEKLLHDTEKARAELETANELKNQFLSVAAHDLKNPLNSIMCIAEILRSEAIEKDSIEMLDLMKSASEKMLSLIIELLDGAALQSKSIQLNKVKTNLSELVERISNDYKIRSNQKDQRLFNRIENEIFVNVDGFWISAAIENVISNAVKYSRHGGEIEVRLSRELKNVIISVRDSGPGFTEEDKSKIFGKFQRLSAKPTGGESSTGLGLSIVKDIIDQHGGKIEIDSTLDEGTVFKLILAE